MALWTPKDIWVHLNQNLMSQFSEDRRLDYKRTERIDFEDLTKYLSAFSNTPDGGLIVFGATSKGMPIGCSGLKTEALNRLENIHLQMCPQAKPEIKRFEVKIDDKSDFCIGIYIPYVGRLVETHKGDAYIRYGDSIHKMSDEEKRDFRATRQELSFELEPAPYNYPDEFSEKIIHDFCEVFKKRENRFNWTYEEILLDRHLIRFERGKVIPLNALVLLAAKDPRKSIPGCRVRIQRFASDVEGSGQEYNPVRDRFIEGNIVEIFSKIVSEMTEAIFDVTWLNKEGKFITTPEYPKWAWFEAIVNACVHRSYSFSGTEITIKFFPNRLEIESPGGFVPPVNEKTIYSTRATRNYHLMEALRYLGYVQMAREGARRIRDSMKEWGLPDPVFKQEVLHGVVVKVTLMNDHETRKRSTDREVAQFFGVNVWKFLHEHEVKIAAYAFRNQIIQVLEVSRITGCTWQTTKKDLDKLVKKGILEFEPGDYVRDPKAHYHLKRKSEE